MHQPQQSILHHQFNQILFPPIHIFNPKFHYQLHTQKPENVKIQRTFSTSTENPNHKTIKIKIKVKIPNKKKKLTPTLNESLTAATLLVLSPGAFFTQTQIADLRWQW